MYIVQAVLQLKKHGVQGDDVQHCISVFLINHEQFQSASQDWTDTWKGRMANDF